MKPSPLLLLSTWLAAIPAFAEVTLNLPLAPNSSFSDKGSMTGFLTSPYVVKSLVRIPYQSGDRISLRFEILHPSGKEKKPGGIFTSCFVALMTEKTSNSGDEFDTEVRFRNYGSKFSMTTSTLLTQNSPSEPNLLTNGIRVNLQNPKQIGLQGRALEYGCYVLNYFRRERKLVVTPQLNEVDIPSAKQIWNVGENTSSLYYGWIAPKGGAQ